MSETYIADGWRQINLTCATWRAAEAMATSCLTSLLIAAQEGGEIGEWWFVRKGPVWRVRLRASAVDGPGAGDAVSRIAEELTGRGAIIRWAEVAYEPEIHAFGGLAAMNVAHDLFSADSHHVLAHLAGVGTSPARTDHRRELGLVLGTRLLRSAGQDWYEQGDIWQRLASHRDSAAGRPDPSPGLIASVGRLITAADDSPISPLTAAPKWPATFERAGRELSRLAQAGRLTRGLRAVLAHHLLFAFNRLGVSAEHQHALAVAAGRAIFQEDTVSQQPVGAVSAEATAAYPAEIRTALADHIRGRGTFRSARVETAFRMVPRHLFLPGIDTTEAYAPRPVVTKRAPNGTAVSSASSPILVAEMLELLEVEPGNRVLEIGAATGINAALIAELTGPTGQVTTIEIDDDLADGARQSLNRAGYPHVEVICGDGALGHPGGAPYDRIVVTAGAWDIPAAWWRQLAPGGRMVVPVRLHGSGLTRVLPLVLVEPDRMVSTAAVVCGFVPIRGSDERPEDHVRLAEEVVLAVDDADEPDHDGLAQALDHPARRLWTGITVDHDEPAEHLDLWLATNAGDSGFGRLSVSGKARAAGVDPALRWAGAALYRAGAVAYLVVRAHGSDADELGIVAHGPDSEKLCDRLDDLLHSWARQRPGQPTITAAPISTAQRAEHPAAEFVRRHTRLAITW